MPRGAAAGLPKKGRPPGPKAHKLPEEFPSGLVLQDFCKKQWQLGSVIGQGGFGLIYLASEDATKSVNQKTADHVIKIEPKDNGPLYCEMHFYQRAAKLSSIQTFISKHRLPYLGIPPFTGAGLHQYNSKEYRFLVLPRFSTDLQKLFVENGKKFPPHVVFAIGLRMIDALQFLHENEFVHADIKASNILLGYAKGNLVTKEIYLVDYGLAYRYLVDGEHKEYKEDPKRAHDGTIEFTSRDAHKGVVPSRRGDLEILGYCMLQWLSGQLPWERHLSDPNLVAHSKERLMSNVSAEVPECLDKLQPYCIESMKKYLNEVNKLNYGSMPKYNQLRVILKAGLSKAGEKDEWKVDFTDKTKGIKRKSTDVPSPAKRSKISPKKTTAKPKPAKETGKVRKKGTASPKAGKAPARSPPKAGKAPARSPPKAGKAPVRSPLNTKSPSAKPKVKTSPKPVGNGVGRTANSKGARSSPAQPKPTKITPLTPAGYLPKSSTKRRVRRVKAVQSDVSIQTSPGLSNNR